MVPMTTKCILGKSFLSFFNAFKEKSNPFNGTSALAVVINLYSLLLELSSGQNSSVSRPLFITVIFSLLHLNSLTIPSLELFDGVIILLMLGATFFLHF